MTFAELQIQLDINEDTRNAVLDKHAYLTFYGYLFVDSEDGQCYLFDRNGRMDDIRQLKVLYNEYVKRDIKKIVIPKSIESIERLAFAYCELLKSVKISKSVKSIGKMAFWDCTSLKEVIFKGKTMDQVRAMGWYPWGIKDKAIIKCS